MSSGVPVEEFLASISPEARALVQRLRRLIRDVYPTAVERVDGGGSAIRYFAGERSVLYLSPDRDQVLLGFERPRALPDPRGLLTFTGAETGHIRITASGTFDESYYRSLVESAFSPFLGPQSAPARTPKAKNAPQPPGRRP